MFTNKSWDVFVKLALCLVMLFSLSSMAAEGERPNVNFNHDQTTFPLRGLHSNTACESCHINGVFKGTPNTCEGCHSRGGASTAKLKPATHIPVVADCSSCHIAQSWLPARFSHNSLTQSCATCHNGTSATGKPSNHIFTRGSCDSCHKTSSWLPAFFSHDPSWTTCSDCHLRGTATKKPTNHIATAAECGSCHVTTTWAGARFIHDASSTNCSSCHQTPVGHASVSVQCSNCHLTTTWAGAVFKHSSGVVNPGTCAISCHSPSSGNQPSYANHSARALSSPFACDTCHRVTSWTVASYNHSSVVTGCTDCHNNTFLIVPSKPVGHTAASNCEACHIKTASSWASVVSFTHAGIQGYYPHAASRTCASCHKSSSGGPIAHTAYYPDCAWCHASQFRAGEHVKTQSPNRVLYTVTELKNCNGACHEYKTNSFVSTNIKTYKSGQHRSTDGGF